MKTTMLVLVLVCISLAMPPRPGLVESGSPLPVFPPGVEIAGPNKLKGDSCCETVTILMQFPDNLADTLERSPARFDSMLYSTGVYTGQPYRQGSLNDFYLENSYGAYDVRGAVAGGGWFLSRHDYADYRDGYYMLSTGYQLALDNMEQVDSCIDFSEFDLNQDGHVDAMFMVHAGADGADNGDVNSCWSHAIPGFSYMTDDGVVIDGVTNVPEFAMVTQARETTMCCIAVMCHELGHLVGLPDLYQGARTQWGVGYWGLMAYGAWGAGGNTPWSPSHMEAWSKVEAGFVTPVVITENTYDLRIPDVETNPVIFKVWRNGADCDTCFYLENRQQKGFDTPLPGAGLAIWHIDPSYSQWYDQVDMEEDSTDHLSHGSGTRPDPHVYHQELGDTSDVLPGNWNRVLFDSTTVPSSRDRLNKPTGIAVSNIRQVGDTIICDVTLDGSVGVAEGRRSLRVSDFGLDCRPNPATSFTLVRLAPFAGGRQLRVFDSSGREVMTRELGNGHSGLVVPLDLHRLPSGVYMLCAGGDMHKLVVSRWFLRVPGG